MLRLALAMACVALLGGVRAEDISLDRTAEQLAYSPKTAGAKHTEMGLLLEAEGQLDPAVQAFLASIQFEHSVPVAERNYNLGRVLNKMEMYEEAYVAYGRAHEFASEQPEKARSKKTTDLLATLEKEVNKMQATMKKKGKKLPTSPKNAVDSVAKKDMHKMVYAVLKDLYDRNRRIGSVALIPALLKEYDGRELRLLRLSHEKYEPEGELAKLGVSPEEEAQEQAFQHRKGLKNQWITNKMKEFVLKEEAKAANGIEPNTDYAGAMKKTKKEAERMEF